MIAASALVELPRECEFIVPQLVVLGLREVDGVLVCLLPEIELVEEVAGGECHLQPVAHERLVGTDAPVLVGAELESSVHASVLEEIGERELVAVGQGEVVVDRRTPRETVVVDALA